VSSTSIFSLHLQRTSHGHHAGNNTQESPPAHLHRSSAHHLNKAPWQRGISALRAPSMEATASSSSCERSATSAAPRRTINATTNQISHPAPASLIRIYSTAASIFSATHLPRAIRTNTHQRRREAATLARTVATAATNLHLHVGAAQPPYSHCNNASILARRHCSSEQHQQRRSSTTVDEPVSAAEEQPSLPSPLPSPSPLHLQKP